MRPAAAAAVGARGTWLARQHPEWDWAASAGPGVTTDTDVEALWATGSKAARLGLLHALRADRPIRGRQLVESTWATEIAADRAELLNSLATGLSNEDEPWLEASLDDRSAVVRAVAARLLDGLVGSRRATRMGNRSRSLVRITGRLRHQLVVELPDVLDESARRDGVVDSGRGELGLRAWWLVQLLAGTPLDRWTEQFGRPPEELVRLAGDDAVLMQGWSSAAARQRHVGWATALLLAHPGQAHLLSVVPEPSGSEVFAALLERPGGLSGPEFSQLVAACPRPWSIDVSRAVVARARAGPDRPGRLALLPVLARGLNPAAADRVEEWINDSHEDDAVRRQVRELHHALTLRQTIAEELP